MNSETNSVLLEEGDLKKKNTQHKWIPYLLLGLIGIGCLFAITLMPVQKRSLSAHIRKPLRFSPDGTFRLMQITDLHYGEQEDEDNKTTKLVENIVESEKPDFIAFTGDMVSGFSWDKTKGWYEKMWKRWTTPIFEKKVPYAYTLGNHDSEADLTRREIVEVDMKCPYSYTELADDDLEGASTFVLPVYSSKNEREVVMNLWFFDSNDYNCLGVKGYGCIGLKTIAWYRETSKRLEKEQGGKKPGVAFMHIPTPEYMYAFNHYPSVGNKTEEICCSSVNTGFIAAIKERGDIFSVFCGHDHDNDYVNEFEGILLGYGRKTGYGCYGPDFGIQRGGRMLIFEESEFKMDTYIINEDLTREVQHPGHTETTIQDVCGGSHPPKRYYSCFLIINK